MKYLFDDKLAPITSTVGFLESECAKTVEAFVRWQTPIFSPQGVALRVETISANGLESTLRRLLPLTTVQRRRHLFIPTKSPWTAYFDNGPRGTDAMSVMSYLAKELGCHGVRAVAVPHTMGTGSSARGRYGATIFELYGPKDGTFLNYVRSISAANDGGKWRFSQSNEPLPFEDPSLYTARTIRDRFTPETLSRYLDALGGIRLFDESFYSPEDAILIEKTGPVPPNLREMTLEEARASF